MKKINPPTIACSSSSEPSVHDMVLSVGAVRGAHLDNGKRGRERWFEKREVVEGKHSKIRLQ